MHETDKDFSIFTEGLHDGLMDTIGMFHAFTPGAFMSDVNAFKSSRGAEARAKSEPFPELFRYTFPELVTTTRNPTPMALRSFVNYAAVFGLRHEIEIRYMPDRKYVLDGKVPTRADYGEVKNRPSLAAMAAEPPAVASAYMKSVSGLSRRTARARSAFGTSRKRRPTLRLPDLASRMAYSRLMAGMSPDRSPRIR